MFPYVVRRFSVDFLDMVIQFTIFILSYFLKYLNFGWNEIIMFLLSCLSIIPSDTRNCNLTIPAHAICGNQNHTFTIPWDFEIQRDHQIPARRPDLMILMKDTKSYSFFFFFFFFWCPLPIFTITCKFPFLRAF